MNTLKWASDLTPGDVLTVERLIVDTVNHVNGDTIVVFTNGYKRIYWHGQGVRVIHPNG